MKILSDGKILPTRGYVLRRAVEMNANTNIKFRECLDIVCKMYDFKDYTDFLLFSRSLSYDC